MIVNLENDKDYRTQSYSYTLHATPLSPSNSEGAVPSMSADLGPEEDPVAFMSMYRKPIQLEEFNVSAKFHATEPTDTDGLVTIAGMSDLENLNVDLTWPVNHWDFFGSIGHLIHSVDGVDPMVVDQFSWDEMKDLDRGWVMPNIQGNGWLLFKQFLSATGLTLYEYGWWEPINAIKKNSQYDSYDIDNANIISSSVTLNTTDSSDRIVVNRYEYTDFLTAHTEISPRFSDDNEMIISVEAGRSVSSEVRTSFSISELQTQHPRCVDVVWGDVTYFSSVYAVFGNDDKPIMAQRWIDNGGDLWIEVNKDDPTVVDVHVKGADIYSLSPFRIAMSSGNNVDYSSLQIFGKGVAIDHYPYQVHTGVTRPVLTDQEEVIENPFLCRHEFLPNALMRAARQSAGFAWNLSFSVPPHQGTMKINDRVKHKGHWWRIDNVTVSQDVVSYVCTEATEISHLNDEYDGLTIEDFNERYKGMDMIEFAAVMLNG